MLELLGESEVYAFEGIATEDDPWFQQFVAARENGLLQFGSSWPLEKL
jgi:hypothetical protein